MSSMTDAKCTCEGTWSGDPSKVRPLCKQHERGKARRTDGTIVDISRTYDFGRREREAGTWSPDLVHLSGVVNVR